MKRRNYSDNKNSRGIRLSTSAYKIVTKLFHERLIKDVKTKSEIINAVLYRKINS